MGAGNAHDIGARFEVLSYPYFKIDKDCFFVDSTVVVQAFSKVKKSSKKVRSDHQEKIEVSEDPK